MATIYMHLILRMGCYKCHSHYDANATDNIICVAISLYLFYIFSQRKNKMQAQLLPYRQQRRCACYNLLPFSPQKYTHRMPVYAFDLQIIAMQLKYQSSFISQKVHPRTPDNWISCEMQQIKLQH